MRRRRDERDRLAMAGGCLFILNKTKTKMLFVCLVRID